MVVEDFPLFYDWLFFNLPSLGLILLAGLLAGLIVGYLVAVFRHGPFEAFYVVAQVVAQALPDFVRTSPRRTWAIAILAIKESLHRKVILVAFAIFAVALLFGGWFVNPASEKPEQIYISFVVWGTQILILLMVMLLSSFSLPEDIKNRTIYTIVTKPVRATEIILGRIVGFGLVGTFLLVLMGLMSYVFVYRGLAHDHEVAGDTQTLASFVDVDQDTFISKLDGRRVSENAVKEALTTFESGHRHRLELIQDIREAGDPPPENMESVVSQESLPGNRILYQRVICSSLGSHRHRVRVEGSNEQARIYLSSALGYFRARVPIYAQQLSFTDREGVENREGINVGNEWSYRGYVDGGSSSFRASLSEARFDFDNFRESRFSGSNDFVVLEMTLAVFRTFKADIQRRVIAGIQFESVPDSELDNKFVSEVFDFETNEFTVQSKKISRDLVGSVIAPDGRTVRTGSFDLFDDFAANGKLRIRLSCREPSQYIGVSRADVYFRASDQHYEFNFFKGYLGIWCQMIIIVSLGVAFSTFLSTPITMLGTVVAIVIGFFTGFIRELVGGIGGGPIESLIRVITQENMVQGLETGVATTLMEQVDKLLIMLMVSLTFLVPNFSSLDFTTFLTHGYAIDIHRIFVALATTFAFCFGLLVVGYFSLKTREIAK